MRYGLILTEQVRIGLPYRNNTYYLKFGANLEQINFC